MDKLYVYAVMPIDFWGGWTPAAAATTIDPEEPYKIDRREYERALKMAKLGAKAAGWEGDMREGPFVAGLPDPDRGDTSFMIGWKQDNNGTTFIASPRELPYLGQPHVVGLAITSSPR